MRFPSSALRRVLKHTASLWQSSFFNKFGANNKEGPIWSTNSFINFKKYSFKRDSVTSKSELFVLALPDYEYPWTKSEKLN